MNHEHWTYACLSVCITTIAKRIAWRLLRKLGTNLVVAKTCVGEGEREIYEVGKVVEKDSLSKIIFKYSSDDGDEVRESQKPVAVSHGCENFSTGKSTAVKRYCRQRYDKRCYNRS